jgi:mannose/cellobiose epimerase-like protein (N-acyl-D-glucosamine 2-epimerase family)
MTTDVALMETSAWLLDCICPFWADAVVDPQGGFREELDADGRALPGTERSVLNQARLTYVFSHASLLRQDPRFIEAANHGFRFLQQARAADGGGWYRVTTTDGHVVNALRDAYDHSFVILAMAWHFRATGNALALQLADDAYAFLDGHLADPVHGGFQEAWPIDGEPPLPRRQNPHMHLLEACLAMHEASGRAVWLERSTALVKLFHRALFDAASSTVIEFFKADWTPAAGDGGRWREPGHSFEWCWLLLQYFRLTGDSAAAECGGRLFAAATRNGIDHGDGLGGLVMDGIEAGGNVVAGSKLLWPQTEYIKACLARAELLGDATARDAAARHIEAMRRHFFNAGGTHWANQLDRDGAILQDGTPARVLYHLFLALAESVRVNSASATHRE